MSIQNGYCFCANEWFLDSRIRTELPLLLLISSLSAEHGYCYADNNYIVQALGIDERSIQRKLKKLVDCEYITITYTKRGTEITSREIRPTKLYNQSIKMSSDQRQICRRTSDKNVGENIINNNIINNKNISDARDALRGGGKKLRGKFVPPTLQEWLDYAREHDLREDRLTTAYQGYAVADWCDSQGRPIRNWKQKLLQVWCKPENKDPDAWLNRGPRKYEDAIAEAKKNGLV